MRGQKLSWLLYIVGSLLVFGSWVGIVSYGLGWLGWFMALAGWIASRALNAPRQRVAVTVVKPPSKSEEIANLDLLRQEGVISEDEFRRERDRILREP